MTTLYLIRHAEAEGNAQGIFQGRCDLPLNERGREQVQFLAERCRSLPFEEIYSSPLVRAVETAKGANRYHHLPIILDEGLLEINAGRMDGRPWRTMRKEFPEQMHFWEKDFSHFQAPDGESIRDVYERMQQAILDIVRCNEGKSIAIVGHACALRCFLCFAKGLPLQEITKLSTLRNTSISCVEFDGKMQPYIVYYNNMEGVPDSLKISTPVSFFIEQGE